MRNSLDRLQVRPIQQVEVSWSVWFPLILILLLDTVANTAYFEYDFLLSITLEPIDYFTSALQSNRRFYAVLVSRSFRIIAGSMLFLLAIFVLKRRHKTLISDIGLTTQNWRMILATGPAIGIIYSIAITIPSIEFFPAHNISFGPPNSVWRHPLIMPLGLIGAVVVGPACEELIFRGIFYIYLRKKMSIIFAVGINTLIFTVLHGIHPRAIVALVLSLITCNLYERTGSLSLCIVIHGMGNFTIIAARFVLLD